MSSIQNIPDMVLSFSEAQSRNIFGFERQAGKNIMQVIRNIDSKLVLDNLTLADGNCMIISIIQQCQRLDIHPHLPAHIQSLVQGTITPAMTSQFRAAVHQFVTENKTGPVIQHISSFLTGSWEDYWSTMLQDGVWGDHVFLSCAARALGINILVIRHSSTKAMPYTLHPGRDVNPAGDSSDSLYLGYTGSVFNQENHYQSLLPAADQNIFPPVFSIGQSPTQNKQQQRIQVDRERQEKIRARTTAARKVDPEVPVSAEDKAKEKREKERLKKAKQRERKRAENPLFKDEETQSRAKRRAAEKADNPDLYNDKHNKGQTNYRAAKKADNPDLYKDNDKKYQAKSRAAKKADNPDLYNDKHNESNAKYRAAERERNPIQMKEKQNLGKRKSVTAQRKKDYMKTKTDQNNRQTKSRAKRKAQTGTDRPDRGVRPAKKKKVEDANDRLKKFRMKTMTGPD